VFALPKSRKSKGDEQGLPSLSLVFGYIAVKELARLQDRVDVLSRLGYGNIEIAKICDSTPPVVAVMKSRALAEKRGRRHR